MGYWPGTVKGSASGRAGRLGVVQAAEAGSGRRRSGLGVVGGGAAAGRVVALPVWLGATDSTVPGAGAVLPAAGSTVLTVRWP